ncbi:hypothetical protein BC936DRAFT_146888 [Jimgerdemannia flammicorona]|uniref:Uncharacterized protein n=1 Tax=Jimgerdemannia flammicorona TaxID=994334 RepID=A0A433D6L9_9FUNG|nr:hypothetical protein BC936DRAFT_146888 [Jimgerdemannia flammicorona]
MGSCARPGCRSAWTLTRSVGGGSPSQVFNGTQCTIPKFVMLDQGTYTTLRECWFTAKLNGRREKRRNGDDWLNRQNKIYVGKSEAHSNSYRHTHIPAHTIAHSHNISTSRNNKRRKPDEDLNLSNPPNRHQVPLTPMKISESIYRLSTYYRWIS